jgi:uncharacterized protein YjiS (DUF1127 family)
MVTEFYAGAVESLHRWRRKSQMNAYRRHAIAELDGLNDRILQDIGVERRSIPELVDAQIQDEAGAPEPRPGFGAQPCAQPC